MELTDRQKQILRAIVDIYVSTAEPVGSKAIAALPDMKFSSATIRNEMADLTQMGPSNVAEGCSRKSQNEFAHFLEISLGSSYEIETQMEIAHILKYVTDSQYENTLEKVQSIEKKLTNLINTIRQD